MVPVMMNQLIDCMESNLMTLCNLTVHLEDISTNSSRDVAVVTQNYTVLTCYGMEEGPRTAIFHAGSNIYWLHSASPAHPLTCSGCNAAMSSSSAIATEVMSSTFLGETGNSTLLVTAFQVRFTCFNTVLKCVYVMTL